MDPNRFLGRVRHQLFLDSLRQTALLAPERMQAYQNRLLEKLLRHAAATVPFYKDRLAAAFHSDGTFRPEGFSSLPLIDRPTAQDNSEALETTDHPHSAGEIVSDQTSGSTGRAFLHKRSALADVASAAQTSRLYEWHGMRLGQRMAEIRVDRSGLAPPPLGRREGLRHVLSIDSDVATQLDWLEEVRPTYLMTYASNLRALAEHALHRNADLRLDRVLTVSETLEDDTRTLCRQALGCGIVDGYGSQEIGFMAGHCPRCEHYHVSSDTALVEVLDQDNRPVAEGRIGRVVVTSLYNYAMPFIRYDIGDHAMRAAAGSACEIALPRLSRIMGRTRNMFTFPGGRQIWPNAFQKDIRNVLPVRQMQVVQEAPLQICVRYVRDPDGAPEDLPSLTAYLRDKLDPRISVRTEEHAELKRSSSGKYEDYLSLVTQ